MGSPYQLILMNLIHIEACLMGLARGLAAVRFLATWRPAMREWRNEQERQLRVLLVLFKQVGGEYGLFHRSMLELAALVGLVGGIFMGLLPLFLIRLVLRNSNEILTAGLERAGDQIALAEWAAWQSHSPIDPPKALQELAQQRRGWPARQNAPVEFL